MILCIYTKDIVVKDTPCMLDIYIVMVVMIVSVCFVKSKVI